MNKNITITLSVSDNNILKIQGTCENVNKHDVMYFTNEFQELLKNNLMDGLNESNGGYFEESINLIK